MSEKHRHFVSTQDVETLELPWGRLHWLCEPRVTGSDQLITGIVELEAGKGHERHNHPGCSEIIYVLEGEGEQFIEHEDGTVDRRHVKAGDLIYVPADMYHGTQCPEHSGMRLLVVYEKTGPEVLLRNSPDSKIIPPENQ